jgi:hypothetical protein
MDIREVHVGKYSPPKGLEDSDQGFNPISAILSNASSVGCILSRRDGTIVARHEVPGIIRKIAPSQRDD